MRIDRVTTRTGDDGATALADGRRLAKEHPLIVALGAVDEANCALGLAAIEVQPAEVAAALPTVQNELFDLGADLATPGDDFTPSEMILRVVQPQIDRLESEIDRMNETLEPLRSFILPGGGEAAARIHVARTIARRAERSVVTASREVAINPLAAIYLNRLSDHLFVLGRLLAKDDGGEVIWQPGATRADA